jgi:hypothetical protein
MSQRECPHCGKIITKHRSSPDHRRFFAVIQRAFEHWPEAHETFAPESPEHLRAWLLCKAGFREATPIMLPDDATDHMRGLFRLAIEASVRAAGGYAWVVPYQSGAAVVKPKSIAWSKVGQSEFSEIRSAVEEIIAAEVGVTADELLKHGEAA